MRFWLFILLCVANAPAMAGLFADDDARKQVKQLESRIVKLEQTLSSSDTDKEQYIRSTLDLQMQMEALNAEVRKLRGQNEELLHNLQDAEKRQKDFYIDLDTRLRRVEAGEAAAASAAASNAASDRVDGTKDVPTDPVSESRAFESAYTLYKSENYLNAATAFRDFLKNFPQSVHQANVYYWMGNAYFLLKDCKNSIGSYQSLIDRYQDHPRVAEAMLNVAECQQILNNKVAAKKTLKQLISQFPGSDASEKAKKRLATIK
jgi:tol-pal system protein YbgF